MTNKSEEAQLIRDIAQRAFDDGLGFKDLVHATGFIAIAHEHCPLRLADLLAAEDYDFAHDIGGLKRHMNLETGDMGGFLPRFHQRKPPK